MESVLQPPNSQEYEQECVFLQPDCFRCNLLPKPHIIVYHQHCWLIFKNQRFIPDIQMRRFLIYIIHFIYFLPNSLYQKLDFISVFSCSVTLNFVSKLDNLSLYALIFLSSNCICSLNCLLVSTT